MAGVNKRMVLGRLGKDPEMKTFDSGATVTKFSVATSDKYKNKEGEWQQSTVWHNVETWNKLAEFCGNYLTKGCEVFIEGSHAENSYTNKKGEEVKYNFIKAQSVQKLTDPLKKDVSSSKEDDFLNF